jgi:hypothetical protein
MYKKIYKYDARDEATTLEQKYRGEECLHIGNVKESTLFWHPQYVYNGVGAGANTTNDRIDQKPKAFGDKDKDVRGYYEYNPKCEVGYQIQLGSNVYPVMEVKTSQEAFYELMKTVKADPASNYAVDILPREYRSWKHIMGVNFQTITGGLPFTGLSTKTNDLLNIKLKGCVHVNDAEFDDTKIMPYSYPDYIYVVLVSDAIVSLTDYGVALYD